MAMPKPKLRLLLLLALLIVGTLVTFVPRSHALALTYPKPSWWNGDTCDSTHYHANNADGLTSSVLATWNGITACGPIPGTDTNKEANVQFTTGGSTENEWQCTELVKRYLFIVFGALSIGNTNGNQVVDTYTGNRSGYTGYPSLFSRLANDGTNHVKVGDVLSYYSPDNHTAIVIDTSGVNGSGNGTITVLEQNASSTGEHTQTVTAWKIKNGVDDSSTNGDTVSYRLTPKESWSTLNPTGTAKIYSMAAASTTSIWAAGIDGGSNPVVYYDNGAGWTKYSPTAQCICNHYLYGIATIPASGETWTVGAYTPSNIKTLAYHWNGTSWVHVTSDNPASSGYSNYLYGAAIDSSGGIWAAGKYFITGSGFQPLVEKWNSGTSNFDKQTVPLPSGKIGAELNSIAFSSSSNGWAVGDVSTSGSPNSWEIYHYDGTSWSSYALGSVSYASLTGVTVVSDSEAWAVGYQGATGAPLILHYTSANGWVEDTSFNGYYPNGALLNSISTDGSSDVWIAGTWYNNSTSTHIPFTMHYNSYYWDEFDPPSVSGNGYLQGMTVISGEAWAGGYFGSSPSPLVYQYS